MKLKSMAKSRLFILGGLNYNDFELKRYYIYLLTFGGITFISESYVDIQLQVIS